MGPSRRRAAPPSLSAAACRLKELVPGLCARRALRLQCRETAAGGGALHCGPPAWAAWARQLVDA
eukprot:4758461-Pyramimonas_sp.AAC.1